MPFFNRAPLRVQPYFGHRTHDRLLLSARALRDAAPDFAPTSRWQAVRTIAAQFLSREAPGVAVELELRHPEQGAARHAATSDAEGFVHFDVPLGPGWDLPHRTAWEQVHVHWHGDTGPLAAEAHVLAPGAADALAVISDIDDTLIETGVTGGLGSVLRNWRRLFAEWPHERIVVPGAGDLYGALGGLHGEPVGAGQPAPPHRPFFYVSSSPWNLFAYLVAFKRAKGLPLGPIKLRDWGLGRGTFGSGSHGSHKREAISAIVAMYPHLRFALIGDDTQDDLPAFAGAVEQHPQRIAAVFLRKTGGEAFSAAEVQAEQCIAAAGVPLWLGESYADALAFLHAQGLSASGSTARIVGAIEQAASHSQAPGSASG